MGGSSYDQLDFTGVVISEGVIPDSVQLWRRNGDTGALLSESYSCSTEAPVRFFRVAPSRGFRYEADSVIYHWRYCINTTTSSYVHNIGWTEASTWTWDESNNRFTFSASKTGERSTGFGVQGSYVVVVFSGSDIVSKYVLN